MIVASLRSTGRSGAEVGNMWKSVLSSIHSDKSIEELKKLGIAVKTTTGDFRPMQDVLSDVMIAMAGTEKNTEEVTKAMAGGKFQWAKLASSLGDVETYYSAVATSIASTGKANEYMSAQMETVSKKAGQLHQALIALVAAGGNSGLNSVIKSIIDNLRYFVDGLNSGGMQVVAFGGATYLAVKAIDNISMAIKTATAAGKAWNITTAISEALLGNWAAIAGAGIVIGVVGLTTALGKQADAEKDLLETQKNKAEQQKAMIAQYDDEIKYVTEIEQTRDKLISQMKGMSDADERKIKLNGILSSTEKDLSQVIGEEGLQHLKAAGFTQEAFKLVEKSLQDKQNAEKTAWENSSKMVQKATDNLKKNILTQIEAVGKATEAYGVLGKLQENGLWLEKSAIYARYQLNPTPENAKAYDDIQAQVSRFYQNQSNNRTKELIAELSALGSSSDFSLQDIPTSTFKSAPLDDSEGSSKAKKETKADQNAQDLAEGHVGIPDDFWAAALAASKQTGVDPYLIAAIGKHETGFGTQGAGREGYSLGYGYPGPGQGIVKYKDTPGEFTVQTLSAAKQIASYMGDKPITAETLADFMNNSWKPGDKKWSAGVFSNYQSLKNDNLGGAGSGGGTNSPEIPSDETPTYTDPTDAILAQISAQATLTKTKSDAIKADIELAKSSKDYAKVLSLTNSLIGSQGASKQLSTLLSERDKINSLKDKAIASSQFGDTSRWFDSKNNASSTYTSELSQQSEEAKVIMEQEFAKMQKLRNDWLNNKSKTDNLFISPQELKDLNTALDAINKQKDSAIATSKFGDISRWFNDANEASQQYLVEFNSQNADVQNAMNAEFSTMQSLRKDWTNNRSIASHLSISAKEMQDLDLAKQKINQLKNALISSSNSKFGDISRWFNDSNEASVTFVNEKNASTSDTQKVMDELFTTMQKLRKAWVDNKKSVDDLIISTNTLKESLIQTEIDKYKQSITDLDSSISQSKATMDLYDKSSKEYSQEQVNQISLLKQKEVAIQNEINSLKLQLQNTELTAQATQLLNEELKNSTLELANVQKSILDSKSLMADDAISILKSYYENQKEMADKAYDAEVEAEDKRHQQFMDNLEAEATKYEETINAQISAIDKLANEEDYNKNLSNSQSEAQDIQNQINIASRDTSPEGRARLADLQKQLKDKNNSIEDMQFKHTNDLRKQNLQDNLEAIKKRIEAEKKADTEIYNAEKERLAKEKQLIDEDYNARMKDEQYWANIRQVIINGNITDINSVLTKFSDGFTTDLTQKATDINNAFKAIIDTINAVNNATATINAANNATNSIGTSNSGNSGGSHSNGHTVVYDNGPNGWTEYDSDGNAIRGGTGTPPAYANGGETQFTGMHWLDGNVGKPERVLSSEQTLSFNKLVHDLPSITNVIDKIMGNINVPL